MDWEEKFGPLPDDLGGRMDKRARGFDLVTRAKCSRCGNYGPVELALDGNELIFLCTGCKIAKKP